MDKQIDHSAIGCLIHDNWKDNREKHLNVIAVYDAIKPYLSTTPTPPAGQDCYTLHPSHMTPLARQILDTFLALVKHGAKFIDIRVRKDAKEYTFEADILKYMKPPAEAELHITHIPADEPLFSIEGVMAAHEPAGQAEAVKKALISVFVNETKNALTPMTATEIVVRGAVEKLATAAIKASGAEHIAGLVDTLLEVLHHAMGAGSNWEITHSHPDKASDMDWIGRKVRDRLSALPPELRVASQGTSEQLNLVEQA